MNIVRLFRSLPSPWPRVIGLGALLAIGFVLWGHSSSGLQDAILWVAFLVAVVRRPRAIIGMWRRWPGILFALVGVYTLATLALSVDPAMSGRDLVRRLDVLAIVVVLPAFLRSPRAATTGLGCSAVVLTLILASDLVRLVRELGPELMTEAHAYEPFALGHSPNVGACAAGMAGIVCVWAAVIRRRSWWRAVAWGVGAVVNLAYLVVIASRGAQLALAATVAAAAVLLPRRHRGRIGLLVVLVVLGAVAVMRPELVNPRFKDAVSMRGFADRDKVWVHTWTLVQDRPIMGYGYGHRVFREVYHHSDPPRARFDFQHPHSYWLSVLFAHGWIGAVLYAAAWGGLAVVLLRRRHDHDAPRDIRELAVVVGLLLVFLHAFGIGDFPGDIARMAMLWLIPCALYTARPLPPASSA